MLITNHISALVALDQRDLQFTYESRPRPLFGHLQDEPFHARICKALLLPYLIDKLLPQCGIDGSDLLLVVLASDGIHV